MRRKNGGKLGNLLIQIDTRKNNRNSPWEEYWSELLVYKELTIKNIQLSELVPPQH